MAALEVDLDLTLAVNRLGVSSKTVYESVSSEAQPAALHVAQVLTLPDATVDEAVEFGGVTTAETVLIVSDVEISVKVNGAAAGIAGTMFLFTGASITELEISNASGGDALVRVYVIEAAAE